jgi:ABC-type nitrate/sulfonate/bicarbonate transport system substrate-binding protein
MRRPRLLLGLLAIALVALSGCVGGSDSSAEHPDQDATLLLDFAPNAVHAGIYLALDRGYDDAEGVHLQVQTPGASTDGIKALLSGRVQMAIVDIHDLALAREQGRDIVGFMAIVQTPLAAVLAQPDIRRPRDLDGKRVGVTGLPSDDAVLRSIVQGDGGRYASIHRTTIGFNAVSALLSHKVAAATAFWNAEGVALQAQRPGIRAFKVDDYGAPSYPELVLATTRSQLSDNLPVIRAAVRAIRRGYEATIQDPAAGVSALTGKEPELNYRLMSRELDAVSPSFTAGAAVYGELDPKKLEAWATWEQRFGITKTKPDVAAAFDPKTSTTEASLDPQ